MKRLWKTIPPCISDVLGFEAVMNQTAGLGIIDDASRYKPLRTGAKRGHGNPMEFHRGPHGFGNRGLGDLRVMDSELRNADIIHGTQQKVLEAFAQGKEQMNPDFVLLSYAPSSSMIGSDLEEDARLIEESSGIPAGCVNIHGDKDYLYGISCTLEAMGKLLLKKLPTIPGTVNLLGCNVIDWHKEALSDVEAMVTRVGYRVLSRWGLKESSQNLKLAPAASVNWVVNVSGLRLAKFMEREFGIPYLVGAPFGAENAASLLERLKEYANAETAVQDDPQCPEALVIGEQFLGNAIRQALRRRGFRSVRVLSFFEMDRACMLTGDAKLSGEDDLRQHLGIPSVRLVLGDPDCSLPLDREIPWISLPNLAGMSPVTGIEQVNWAGGALDEWLDNQLRNGGNT